MSENTVTHTVERGTDRNLTGGAYQNQEIEPGRATEESHQLMACSYDQPQAEGQDAANQGNALNQFVTKVPQADAPPAEGMDAQQNLHQ